MEKGQGYFKFNNFVFTYDFNYYFSSVNNISYMYFVLFQFLILVSEEVLNIY